MEWDDHFEELAIQCGSNFEMCNRLQVSEELALGEYADKSIIMTQLKKRMKDPEKPPLLVEIDPWTRYAPLAATIAAKQRNFTRKIPRSLRCWLRLIHGHATHRSQP